MGYWKFLLPEATKNQVKNPRAEDSSNYTAEAGTTVTRPTTYSKFGHRAFRIQTNADNEGIEITLDTLSNAAHYVTMFVRGTLPTWDWSLDDANWTTPTKIRDIDDNWALYGAAFVAAQANGSTTLHIHQDGAGTGDFYLDGIQVEAKDHRTTHCNGEIRGCLWDLGVDKSSSTRSDQSRFGGREYDFQDDYNFDISEMIGTGMVELNVKENKYAILPGGELNTITVPSRTFELVGTVRGTSYEDMHSKVQGLIDILSPFQYAPEHGLTQPITIRYTEASVVKEIRAYYSTGLEGRVSSDGACYWQKVSIRFKALDPKWYEIGGSAQALEPYDGKSFSNVAQREYTGDWTQADMANTGSDDGIDGVEVYDVLYGPDGRIYICGDFTNWKGDAESDYVAVYDPEAGTWGDLTGAAVFTDKVLCMCADPDGDTIYFGGEFSGDGPGANLDYFCAYSISGDSFSMVGDPESGAAAIDSVDAIAIGLDGKVWVGGDFLNFADVAAADQLAYYDQETSSWGGVSAGSANESVLAIAIEPITGDVYIGGSFDNWTGDADIDKIAYYDISAAAWVDLELTSFEGAGVTVYALAFDKYGKLYVGGSFSNADGIAEADNIFMWDKNDVHPLGTGLGNTCRDIVVGPDGIIWVVGNFVRAGEENSLRIARWNQYAWTYSSIQLYEMDGTNNNNAYCITVTREDPVVKENYGLFVGSQFHYPGIVGKTTAVTNDGTFDVYPKLVIKRTDSRHAATCTVKLLKNQTSGDELYFNYSMRVGEKFEVDLEPQYQTAISNYYGPRLDAILPNSDFGQWHLQPGSNSITSFISILPKETNDNNNQISGWYAIDGLTEDNTDDGRLYVTIVDLGGGSYRVDFYDDAARTNKVAATGSYSDTGPQAVSESGGSGIGGYIDIDATTAADADIYVDFPIFDIWLEWRDTYSSQD